jgi:hypothetical protein
VNLGNEDSNQIPAQSHGKNLISTHSNGTEETSESHKSYNDKRDPTDFSLADFVKSQSVSI